MSNNTTFKVGDSVVYPSHGVGEIIKEETQAIGGVELKVYVIEFKKEKMILRVPVKRAGIIGLRAISSNEVVQKMVNTLQGRAKVYKGMWSRRAQEYENKINSGNIVLIAEVVRDLHKNVDDPDRSYSERVIYETALGRLIGEFAAVENIDTKQAADKLSDILAEREAA
ncbi:MAG: CarD family transcriptional regulator [Rickettsiales endosymbiont of Dermacentor nuttalli]